MSCQQKGTLLAETTSQLLTITVRGPCKELRGLIGCQDPRIPSLSVPSDQRTNGHVHDLNVATKKIYGVPQCITLPGDSLRLNPLIFFVGASVKSRCLGKRSHPSCLSKQVKTVNFISEFARLWRIFNQMKPLLWSSSHAVTCKSPLEAQTLAKDHLMKIRHSFSDEIAVGSLARAQSEFVRDILGRFSADSGRSCGRAATL